MNTTKKGKALARYAAKVMKKVFPRAKPMPRSGGLRNVMPSFRADIANTRPWAPECKNQERLNLREAMRQTKEAANHGELPCVIDGRGRWDWENPEERALITFELPALMEALEELIRYGWRDAEKED